MRSEQFFFSYSDRMNPQQSESPWTISDLFGTDNGSADNSDFAQLLAEFTTTPSANGEALSPSPGTPTVQQGTGQAMSGASPDVSHQLANAISSMDSKTQTDLLNALVAQRNQSLMALSQLNNLMMTNPPVSIPQANSPLNKSEVLNILSQVNNPTVPNMTNSIYAGMNQAQLPSLGSVATSNDPSFFSRADEIRGTSSVLSMATTDDGELDDFAFSPLMSPALTPNSAHPTPKQQLLAQSFSSMFVSNEFLPALGPPAVPLVSPVPGASSPGARAPSRTRKTGSARPSPLMKPSDTGTRKIATRRRSVQSSPLFTHSGSDMGAHTSGSPHLTQGSGSVQAAGSELSTPSPVDLGSSAAPARAASRNRTLTSDAPAAFFHDGGIAPAKLEAHTHNSPALAPKKTPSMAHIRPKPVASVSSPILSATRKKPLYTTPVTTHAPDTRKTSHKHAEQKRRDSLKLCFEELRRILPPVATILRHVPDHEKRPGEGNVGGQRNRMSQFDPANPNKGVSKVALLRRSNEYIQLLHGRLDRRDDAISQLTDRLRAAEALLADNNVEFEPYKFDAGDIDKDEIFTKAMILNNFDDDDLSDSEFQGATVSLSRRSSARKRGEQAMEVDTVEDEV